MEEFKTPDVAEKSGTEKDTISSAIDVASDRYEETEGNEDDGMIALMVASVSQRSPNYYAKIELKRSCCLYPRLFFMLKIFCFDERPY